MQVTAVSGNTIAQLDEDELHYMVESGQPVRDLKRRLSAQVGCSRFQQRLFCDVLGELEDDLGLRTLSSVQLVILPLCAPHDTMEKELLTSCQGNNVAHIERLLQKPMDPNRDGLAVLRAYRVVAQRTCQTGVWGGGCRFSGVCPLLLLSMLLSVLSIVRIVMSPWSLPSIMCCGFAGFSLRCRCCRVLFPTLLHVWGGALG